MTTIKVNVFNLTPLNKVFACCKVGVYHTSVVIGEKYEFYYGFAQWGYTGVDSPEKLNHLPSSMTGSFHSSYIVGQSELSLEDCHAAAIQIKSSKEWMSDSYHLLMHNCNDFTRVLCTILLGEEKVKQNYPFWVSRGINIGKFMYSICVSHFFCFVKKIPSICNPTLSIQPEPSSEYSFEPQQDVEEAE